jgi:hypothetical protein
MLLTSFPRDSQLSKYYARNEGKVTITVYMKDRMWLGTEIEPGKVYFLNLNLQKYAGVPHWQDLVVVDYHDFQQCVGIPMGKNYTPLFRDLFLHSFEAGVFQTLLH